jgi:hypothetical protein
MTNGSRDISVLANTVYAPHMYAVRVFVMAGTPVIHTVYYLAASTGENRFDGLPSAISM